jgi:hypothetical protein
MTAPRIRVDLHAHTRRSPDAWTSPKELVRRAAAAGLDRIAVTDHGRLDGAREAAAADPARVIVGLEIHCREGVDLIGLFIRAEIPDGLPALEVAATLRAQGGVVYAPHPFAYRARAGERAALVLGAADVAEVFNSRAFLPMWNRRAAAAVAARRLPGFASSDAHFPWEIGRAWTELPAFDGAEAFLAAAGEARPAGHRLGSPWLHLGSAALSLARGRRIRL